MANSVSQLLVKMVDGVSGPARKAAGALRGIGQAADGINRVQTRLRSVMERNNQALDAARGRMVDAVAMGYALKRAFEAPVTAAVSFQTQLEDIGQKAAIPQERLAALGQQVRKVARDVNQAGSVMAGGLDTLVGFGLKEDDALKLLRPIGRAATAYNAAVGDLSQAGYAALANLKVPAEEFGRALDAMAKSGKEGAFELKDMARYFPSLGAAYQGLGQKGVSAVADLAAALQVARLGAGDSAEAATNLGNVLQKINAPATRRAFKKMGVNLEKEMKKAAERGLTPIEAIAEITNKTLKGNLGKLGDLFEDAQVQKGLRAIIQNVEEYRRIRREAMAAQGVVEEDYQRRLKTTAGNLARFRATMENLNIALGVALLPSVNQIADKLSALAEKLAQFAEQYPDLTSNVVKAAAAIVGFRIAMSTLSWIGLMGKGGALSMLAAGFGLVGRAGRPLLGFFQTLRMRTALATAATGRAPGVFARLADALLVLGRGITRFPVAGVNAVARVVARLGWVGALLAAAGALIYLNWSGLKEFFAGFADAFAKGIEPIQPTIDKIKALLEPLAPVLEPVKIAIQTILDPLGTMMDKLAPLAGYLTASDEAWRSWGETLGGGVANAVNLVVNAIEKVIGVLGTAIDKAKAFASAIKNMAGFGAGPEAEMPSYDQNGIAVPARAKGGPISPGRPYLVGEEGPEIITPTRSGYVHSNDTLAATGNVGAARASQSSMVVNQTNHIAININEATNAREIGNALRNELNRAIRGVQSDYGFGFSG